MLYYKKHVPCAKYHVFNNEPVLLSLVDRGLQFATDIPQIRDHDFMPVRDEDVTCSDLAMTV